MFIKPQAAVLMGEVNNIWRDLRSQLDDPFLVRKSLMKSIPNLPCYTCFQPAYNILQCILHCIIHCTMQEINDFLHCAVYYTV